jgi:nitrate reductase delta subunit
MNIRLKIASALLRYPGDELGAALPEIAAAIRTAGFTAPRAAALLRLCRRLGAGNPLDRQEEYVRLFDRGRATSLHLFEHVHGDTRNRGPAMIELARAYESAGFALDTRELPDFVPLLFEFLAVAPPPVAQEVLAQAAPILDALHGRLMARGRPEARAYAAAIAAALDEAGVVPSRGATTAEEAEDDAEAIDRAWEDTPVSFGPESDPDRGRARAGIAAMIQHLRTARTRARA